MIQHIFKFPKPFTSSSKNKAIPVYFLKEKNYEAWKKKQNKSTQSQLKIRGFTAKPKQICKIIDAKGNVESFVSGISDKPSYLESATLATGIKNNFSKDFVTKHSFVIKSTHTANELNRICIGWGLAAYKFDLYKKDNKSFPVLQNAKKANMKEAKATVESISLLKNLINTPANILGTDELAAAAKKLAAQHKATVKIIKNEQLQKQNFPMIYAVGKASPRRPQLVDIKWGKTKDPKITIVGKGIVYDTGGLNLKPGQYMRDMKKDMGGAAHALGVAAMIMALKLPVRLHVLLPIAENAVAGNSYRPGDILETRKGLSVEIEDTDAEGRLVVADALTYACESKPDLLIDFCTLTGAARVGVGYDIPAFFSNNDNYIEDLRKISFEHDDPCWPFPLFEGYDSNIDGDISDIRNEGTGRAGHIEAALFLQRFITPETDWIHLDCFAWERQGKPGRPKGGADTGMLAIFNLIKERYT